VGRGLGNTPRADVVASARKNKSFQTRGYIVSFLNAPIWQLFTKTTAVICFAFSVAMAFAFEIDNPLKHFIYPTDYASSPKPVVSWAEKDIDYNVVGNKSQEVDFKIARFMEMVSKNTDLRIVKSKHSKIYIIYDDSIIDQLMNDQTRLKAVGFPDHILAALKNRFLNEKSLNCVAQANTDVTGSINSAFILSRATTDSCIKPMLYGAFGLEDIDNDIAGMTDACVLYNARSKGLRLAEEIAPKLAELVGACNQPKIPIQEK
jgi:hypothetical protein